MEILAHHSKSEMYHTPTIQTEKFSLLKKNYLFNIQNLQIRVFIVYN